MSEKPYKPVQSTGDARRKYGKIPAHRIPPTTSSKGHGLRHRSIALQKYNLSLKTNPRQPYGKFTDTRQASQIPDHSTRSIPQLKSKPNPVAGAPMKLKGLAVSGSVSEIRRTSLQPKKQRQSTFTTPQRMVSPKPKLPQNMARARKLTPWWRVYQTGYGSLKKEQKTGTFG